MDATDRQMMIEQLQRDNAEARERIAAAQAARESDPIAHDDWLHESIGSPPVRKSQIDDAMRVADENERTSGALIGEHDENAMGSSYTRKKDAAATLIYRRHENSPAHALRDTGEPSSENELGLFGDERDAMLSRAIGYVISHERHARRQELEKALISRDRKIGELEGELREIRGMLGATLQLLGTANAPKKLWTP